jgi:hypothetical protein
LAIKVQAGHVPTLDELLDCHAAAIRFFNSAEALVGSSGLLGAHSNGFWVTGFAETCYAVLEVVVEHYRFLQSHWASFPSPAPAPAPQAYANMQRMVVEYLHAGAARDLKTKFLDNKLPTTGFDMPAAADADTEEAYRQKVKVSLVVGGLLLLLSVVIAVFIPHPTRWQEFVFRGTFSIGLAAFAAVIPGFVKVNARVKGWGNYLQIIAGGAVAIFVIVWLVNPPHV